MRKQVVMFILGIFFILIILNAVSATDRNVGPGYAYTNITAAINAASTGDTINVYDNGAPYTYNENVVINKTNLTITAKGNVTVKAKYNTSAVFSVDYRGNGSSINNFKITGSTESWGIFCDGSYVSIKNNSIYNNAIAISIAGGRYNNITNNTIYNNSAQGLYIHDDYYTTISGNTIENNGNLTEVTGSGIGTSGSYNLKITHNTIKDNPYGIAHDASYLTIISANNLINNIQNGIELISTINCQITGNNISFSTNGIVLSTANPDYPTENNTISGNYLTNCERGIELDLANRNTIQNNTIKNNGMGIATYTAGRNIIKSNIISNNDDGIYSANDAIIIGNEILKNTITNNSNGIAFSGSTNNKIYENIISSNINTGIDIQGATGNNITGNKITGNNIGIHTDDTYQTSVHFNSIVGNTLYGISNYFISLTGASSIVDARYNWWGSNSNPSSKIQNIGTGSVIYNPWLVLKISSASNLIGKGIKTTITADLTQDSNGIYHNPVNGHILDGISIKFTTTLGTITSMVSTVNGVAKATLTGGSASGIANVSAVMDNQTVKKSVTIDATAPRVSWTVPKNLATGVSRTSTIVIKFSENIKTSINWNKMYVKNLSTGKLIPIGRSISGNTLYIKTSTRTAYTWYQVYIPGYSVKDSASNNLAAGYWFKFKTGRY